MKSYGGVNTEFDAFALLATDKAQDNRWYTYPSMTQDEVLVFRAYDSQMAAREEHFWTPHCAFTNPIVEGVARCSVEMRAICLFW